MINAKRRVKRIEGVPGRQRGVSLVEVLVSVVVLSIGLLGLAGLQASGIRVSQSSIHRGQAAQVAYDIVDRIRANVANAGEYEVQLGAVAKPNNAVAATDMQDWRLRLQSLPDGDGAVTINGTEVTVVVQWDDMRGAGVLRGTAADDAALAKLKASQLQITAQLAN
jgi:type IV pilus assembly protein PilV